MFTSFDGSWLADRFGPVRSVALVGNGPSAGRSGLGAAIDGCDLVVRMNTYQIDGFQQHVGRRADLFVSHLLHTYCASRLRADGVRGVLVSRPVSQDFAHNAGLGSILRNRQLLEDLPTSWVSEPVFAELYESLGIPIDDVTGRNPSSGLVALRLIAELPTVERLVVSGFDGFAAHERIHYFPDPVYDSPERRAVVAYSHPTLAERAIVRQQLQRFRGEIVLSDELSGLLQP